MVRRAVHLGILHKERHQFQQGDTEEEPDDRRHRKRNEDLLSLVPVDRLDNRLSPHEGVRDPHSDDRADVGVRRRVRHAQPPGAEVPPEGRDDQRQEERDLIDAVDAGDYFIGQQVHQPERHRSATRQDAEEIHERGERHGGPRLHGVGIDHRRDCVGRVVESVHGLLEHDQEEDEYQNAGGYGRQTCEELHQSLSCPCLRDWADVAWELTILSIQPKRREEVQKGTPTAGCIVLYGTDAVWRDTYDAGGCVDTD